MVLRSGLIFLIGLLCGLFVVAGLGWNEQSAGGVPPVPDTEGDLISITRDDAQAAQAEYCNALRSSTPRYVEEQACNDLCGVIDVERKLCFYSDVQIDELGERVLDKEQESCEASGGVMPACTASRCDSDGSCTEDCAVACHFESLTPVE